MDDSLPQSLKSPKKRSALLPWLVMRCYVNTNRELNHRRFLAISDLRNCKVL